MERALNAMRRADIVVAIVDASEGITQQVRVNEMSGYVEGRGKTCGSERRGGSCGGPTMPFAAALKVALAMEACSHTRTHANAYTHARTHAHTHTHTHAHQAQDFRLTEMAANEGRAVVVVVNKWDKVDTRLWTEERYMEDVKAQLRHVGWASVVCTTANKGGWGEGPGMSHASARVPAVRNTQWLAGWGGCRAQCHPPLRALTPHCCTPPCRPRGAGRGDGHCGGGRAAQAAREHGHAEHGGEGGDGVEGAAHAAPLAAEGPHLLCNAGKCSVLLLLLRAVVVRGRLRTAQAREAWGARMPCIAWGSCLDHASDEGTQGVGQCWQMYRRRQQGMWRGIVD